MMGLLLLDGGHMLTDATGREASAATLRPASLHS